MKSICDNFDDGSYRLPTPDSREYHAALVELAAAGDTSVAIGFSDERQQGDWINVYNGTISIIKLLLKLYLRSTFEHD